MSNPTTPFSWQMPTATDLVTDLPADFEVFGQAVATSMADLLGGTTGQVLSKTTDADMDFTWVAANPGDITAVTAGTGISGGGTSGAVTITNSMATEITAKGDLIVGTGSATFDNLAAGANGSTIVADSSTSTGLRYQSAYNGNAIINGGFDVWQRGTSIAAQASASSAAYTADRFQFYRGGGALGATMSRQASGNTGIQYCARVQRDSGNTSVASVGLYYTMESADSYRFANQTITVSFYARAGANFSAASSAYSFAVCTGTGSDQNVLTGFTGSAFTYNTATLTTSWQRFSYQVAIGATATQIGLYTSYTPVGTAGAADYFEITGVQLELGSVATTFKRSNGSGGTIQGELAACQRYLPAINTTSSGEIGLGMCNASTSALVYVGFPVPARVTPTGITTSAANTFTLRTSGGGGAGTPTTVTFNSASVAGCSFSVAGSSGLVAGNATSCLLNGQILFTGCEL